MSVGHIGHLDGLPLPPSSNNIYFSSGRRRFSSEALLAFKDAMRSYGLMNHAYLRAIREELAKAPAPIWFDRVFRFERSRLWTKSGKPKKLDVSNRIKALDDCLADLLGIDDLWIFGGSEEKMAVESTAQEGASVVVSWAAK